MFPLVALLAPAAAFAAEPPPLTEPLRTGAHHNDDAAIVIGNEDYFVLPDVPHARADADAVHDLLVYTRGIPEDRVRVLRDANKEEMEAAVTETAALVGDGGTLWVYYAGHGITSTEDGGRLWIGIDAKATEIALRGRSIAESSVSAVAGAGDRNALVIVDACFGGSGRDGGELLPGKRTVVPPYVAISTPRVVTWAATKEGELAGGYDSAGHGLFTYFVLGALRGWADGAVDDTTDSRVSLQEAQAYVAQAVRTVGDGSQHPTQEARSGMLGWQLAGPTKLEAGPDLAPLRTKSKVVVVAGPGDAEQARVLAATARSLSESGRPEEALVSADAAVAKAPDDPVLYGLRANIREQLAGPASTLVGLRAPVAGVNYAAMATVLRAEADDLDTAARLAGDPEAAEEAVAELRARAIAADAWVKTLADGARREADRAVSAGKVSWDARRGELAKKRPLALGLVAGGGVSLALVGVFAASGEAANAAVTEGGLSNAAAIQAAADGGIASNVGLGVSAVLATALLGAGIPLTVMYWDPGEYSGGGAGMAAVGRF